MVRLIKTLQTHKIQFALALVLAVGFLIVPVYGVHAFDLFGIADTAGAVLVGIINSLLSIIVTLLGVFLGGIASLADAMMQPVPITTNPTVQQAWGITRDFANMFFILILLAIALDFILFNSFRVKQMIPRLVLVALLINFSLPIAGVLIDFSNVFTQFFLSQVTGTTQSGLTSIIASNLDLPHILDVVKTNVLKENATEIQFNVLKTMVFGIIFMFGTAFVFLVLALMFVVRTGYLYVLLVTLPLALVLSAFPPTANYFKDWTNNFVKWTMFAPIATFFLWFAIFMFHELLGKNIGATGDTFILSFYKYVVVWVFLLGAITAAQKMSGSSAKIAMGIAGWAKGKTLNGLRRGRNAGLAAAGRNLKVDERIGALADRLQSKTFVGAAAAGGLRSISAKTKIAMTKQEELSSQKKAELEAIPKSARAMEQKRYLESKLPGSGAAAAHISMMMARDGQLKVLDSYGNVDVPETENLVRKSYAEAKKHKNKAAMDSILKTNPIVAQKIIDEEWHDRKNEGVRYYTNPKTNETELRNIKTGKNYEDAKNEAFDISAKDFENTKGQWDQKSVDKFIESGYLNSIHLRVASETNNDIDFIKYVQKYFDTYGTTNITTKNPTLANSYNAGNLTRFGIAKPQENQQQGGQGTKITRKSGEDKRSSVWSEERRAAEKAFK